MEVQEGSWLAVGRPPAKGPVGSLVPGVVGRAGKGPVLLFTEMRLHTGVSRAVLCLPLASAAQALGGAGPVGSQLDGRTLLPMLLLGGGGVC